MASDRMRHVASALRRVAGILCVLLAACGGSGGPIDPGTDPDPPVGPPVSLSELFGPVLYTVDGDTVGIHAVQRKAVVGIYFAARTCPACGTFAPKLVRAYGDLMAAGASFEVVLASADASATEMFAHMRQYAMPWLAMGYDRNRFHALVARYEVRFVPTLIVIDGAGVVITRNGCSEIEAEGAGAFDDWFAASGDP